MFIFVLFPSISFSPPKPSEPTTRCNHPSSGYNVTERLTGAATVDAYFAVAGCLTPTIIGNRGCGDGPAVTYSSFGRTRPNPPGARLAGLAGWGGEPCLDWAEELLEPKRSYGEFFQHSSTPKTFVQLHFLGVLALLVRCYGG